VAATARFADPVNRLGCPRGVSALTGLALTVEIGDWSRFSGSSIGAYIGLVPSEFSSGTSRLQGLITKHSMRSRSPPTAGSLRPATNQCQNQIHLYRTAPSRS